VLAGGNVQGTAACVTMKAIIKLLLVTSCFVAATWWTYNLHGSPKVGVDDANLFFSYAQNVASGNGITYAHNPEHVEGVTSMLWMLICALVFSLGGNESAVLFVATSLAVLTQWILLGAIRRLAMERNSMAWPYEWAYIALIVSSPAYVTWMTITLMDTCLWGLIIAAMAHAVVSPPASKREGYLAAIPFALAPIARPEGMLVAPVFASLLWLRFQPGGLRFATRVCIGIGCALLVTTTALTAFRLLYFGYPLPNTYYAKVSPLLAYNLQEGEEYLCEFVSSGTIVGGCVAVVLLVCAASFGNAVDRIRSGRSLRSLFRNRIGACAAMAFAALTLLLVPVVTGGDHFNMFRLYQPAYPLLCVTLLSLLLESRVFDVGGGWGIAAWGRRNVGKTVATGIVVAYWLFAYSSGNSWNSVRRGSPIDHEFRIAEQGIARGRKLGALLAQEGRPFPAIGVITSGGIARTYPGPIVDLMGLNNTFIGHFKGDRKGQKNHAAFEKDAFFQVEPDILLASPPVPPATKNYGDTCLKGLFEDPRFTARWRYGILSKRAAPASGQRAFFRADFLKNLPAETDLVFRDTRIWLSNRWRLSAFLGRPHSTPPVTFG
jgi:arabinofuranosyltransferase